MDSLGLTPALRDLVKRVQAGAYQRIVLTGMGGSYHMLHPLQLDLIAKGWNCFLIETSELLHSSPRLLHGCTLTVALSQSGLSAELVHLATLPREDGHLLAVTNTPGSVLAQSADSVLFMRAGEEHSVSCKTSVASLAALHWLSAALTGGGVETAKRDVAPSVAAVAEYLSRWREHVEWLAGELEHIQALFLVGRGRSLATSGLGGCIIKEAAHFHSEGMSAAQFRHGPMEMLSRRVYVVIFADGRMKQLATSLAEDVRRCGGRAALVGHEDSTGPFRLPELPAPSRSIAELLPPQMISLALAVRAGREPGRFEHITKVTTVE